MSAPKLIDQAPFASRTCNECSILTIHTTICLTDVSPGNEIAAAPSACQSTVYT